MLQHVQRHRASQAALVGAVLDQGCQGWLPADVQAVADRQVAQPRLITGSRLAGFHDQSGKCASQWHCLAGLLQPLQAADLHIQATLHLAQSSVGIARGPGLDAESLQLLLAFAKLPGMLSNAAIPDLAHIGELSLQAYGVSQHIPQAGSLAGTFLETVEPCLDGLECLAQGGVGDAADGDHQVHVFTHDGSSRLLSMSASADLLK